MEFTTDKPIYRQIIDFCFGKILTGGWEPGNRVPSVRELAALLTVNPHTVLKAFEYLQQENIIYPKRGMGFFLNEEAKELVIQLRKKEFFDNQLAELFSTMHLLDVDIKEIIERYNQYKNSEQ